MRERLKSKDFRKHAVAVVIEAESKMHFWEKQATGLRDELTIAVREKNQAKAEIEQLRAELVRADKLILAGGLHTSIAARVVKEEE